MYDLYQSLQRFCRLLKIKNHFDNQPNSNQSENVVMDKFIKTFKKKSTWSPPSNDKALELFIETVNKDFGKTNPMKPTHSNLSRTQQQAIKSLTSNKDIVIKKADKGSAVVLMNTNEYLLECYKQLSDSTTYEPLEVDPTIDFNIEIQKDIDLMLHQEIITDKLHQILSTDNPRTSNFYILPKIHKKGCPGRPILSANGCPTEKISGFVDVHIRKYVESIPSYIKDTTHFLKIINELPQPLPKGSILVSFDVTALYTNIPHDEAVIAIKTVLDKDTDKEIDTIWITKMLTHVLQRNAFQINGLLFLQKLGVAMGTRCAPSVANIFMYILEENIINSFHLKPLVWKRFIDDIFCIWPHGLDTLKEFTEYLNIQHHSIKFTLEFSDNEINFLDTKVILVNGNIHTDLYVKPTDTHCYLHYESSHAENCKKSGPYSQLIRIKRICSKPWDFCTHQESLVKHYLNRGYPAKYLLQHVQNLDKLSRHQLLYPIAKTNDTTQPRCHMIMTYHPCNPPLVQILRKHWHILNYANAHSQFALPPMVGYRRLPNLRDILIKADLKLDLPRSSATTKSPTCPKPACTICWNLNKSQFFFSNQSLRRYQTNLKVKPNCQLTNLVYLLTCKTCQIQYVGETKRTLCVRVKEHLADIKHVRDKPVSNHMQGHTCKNIKYQIIHMIDMNPSDPKGTVLRKQKELYWIHQLRTPTPRGLNFKDDYQKPR